MMADSATAKDSIRPGASFVRRYGSAFASVTGALLLDLLFRRFNLPHPFAAFALSAIAITFWYGGTMPRIVAALLSSLIRGFIFEGETSSLSRVLYELVFLTFGILMIWVRQRKEALEVAIVDRTAKLTAANEDLQRQKEQLDRSERELRDGVNMVPAHVWSTSPEGQVDFVNDRWLQFTGLALDETLGWRWEAVLHPDDRTRVHPEDVER